MPPDTVDADFDPTVVEGQRSDLPGGVGEMDLAASLHLLFSLFDGSEYEPKA